MREDDDDPSSSTSLYDMKIFVRRFSQPHDRHVAKIPFFCGKNDMIVMGLKFTSRYDIFFSHLVPIFFPRRRL